MRPGNTVASPESTSLPELPRSTDDAWHPVTAGRRTRKSAALTPAADRREKGVRGQACRGLVSREIVQEAGCVPGVAFAGGKGVCIAEVPSNRFIENI